MRNQHVGFSIIELMVVLVVAGIILAFGVPSFNSQIKNSRLTSAVNEVVAAMHRSRSEASLRRQPVVMCTSSNAISSDNESCDDNAQWRDGWLIFADLNANDTYDGADEILARHGPQSDRLNVSSSDDIANTITYLPTGFAQVPLNTVSGRYIVYCDKSENNDYSRVLSFSNSGRPSIIPWEDANGAPSCVSQD